MTPLDTQVVGCTLNHLVLSELKRDLKREGAPMSREPRRRPVPHRLLLSFGTAGKVTYQFDRPLDRRKEEEGLNSPRETHW